MQEDAEVKGRRWTESKLSTVTTIAALSAGGLYFVGWQYKQSLALTFGLAGYPGDLSFQGTVATGVSVFDSSITPLVALALVLIRFVILILDSIPAGLKCLLNVVRRRLLSTLKNVRKLRSEYKKLKAVDEKELKRMERQTSRLAWQAKWLSRFSKVAEHSLLIAVVVISGVALTTLLVLFYAGHLVAQMDAKAIRIQAEGACAGCFIFDAKPTKVIGIPLFQSGDTIYVQGREGLARIGVGKLRTIRPYGQPQSAAFKLPRR